MVVRGIDGRVRLARVAVLSLIVPLSPVVLLTLSFQAAPLFAASPATPSATPSATLRAAPPKATARGWRRLYRKEGVTVMAKDRPGADLPILRGSGVLATNLYLLLAIIDDVPRHKEWVYRLVTSKLLSRPDPLHARAYLHFNFPWPISDRDGLIDVVVERRWRPHHELWIRFRRVVDRRLPPRDGIIRVPRTIGFTRLRWLGPNRTHVLYQIDTDPAGSLPRWLVRWISEDLPLRIVRGLRRQLIRRRGAYVTFARVWDPRLTAQPDAPPDFLLPGVDVTRLPGRKVTPAPLVVSAPAK